MIATKFCPCHVSCAVMACAKMCSNLMSRYWIITKKIHWIWSLSVYFLSLVSENGFVSQLRYLGWCHGLWLPWWQDWCMGLAMWTKMEGKAAQILRLSVIYAPHATVICVKLESMFLVGGTAWEGFHSVENLSLDSGFPHMNRKVVMVRTLSSLPRQHFGLSWWQSWV